ncbi:MAG: thioredoxin domain-containing protein [Synergistaceae bacterium]|nr:thioredoxin domain-containing protein [Synergistaceae bacterium]
MPIDLNKENCDAEVKESALPVVVDFWSPSCGPCMAFMPKFLEIVEKYEGKVKFCKVDTSQNKRVAINFKVMSIPTLLFWKDGVELARLVGGDVTTESVTGKVEEMIA